jgi:HSP20 family protein
MTMVKLNQRPFEKTFNSLFEDIFQNLPNTISGNEWNGRFNNEFAPVNIRENANAFTLDVVAPGMEKQDFKLNLEKNLLTISAEKKVEQKEEQDKIVKREFSFRSLSRSFKIDESIDTSSITAKYENGILHITLPKKEEVKLVPKEISIS